MRVSAGWRKGADQCEFCLVTAHRYRAADSIVSVSGVPALDAAVSVVTICPITERKVSSSQPTTLESTGF